MSAKESPSNKDKWVVMIYMAATSPRLRVAMERDLRELNQRLANLERKICVVVQADTPDGEYVTRQRFRGHRVETLPAMCRTAGESKEEFLTDFIHWRFDTSRPDSPAKEGFGRTLLILWGHAQGVAAALSQPGSPVLSVVGRGGFGFDPLLGEALTLPQIRGAIVAGLKCPHGGGCGGPHRIDMLSFDSCFMSAAEAAVELQETPGPGQKDPLPVDYLLAAQTAILLDGLDYSRLADAFVPNPGIDPEVLGRRLLAQAAYGDDSPTSLSLMHLAAPKPAESATKRSARARRPVAANASSAVTSSWPTKVFERKFGQLVEQLARLLGVKLSAPGALITRKLSSSSSSSLGVANRSEWLRIRDAFEAATWHRVRQFVDLGDLCRRLCNNSRDVQLRKAAWEVLDALRVQEPSDIPRSNTDSFLVDVRSAHPLVLSGVSLYCPWLLPTPTETRAGAWNAVVDVKEYAELRFAKVTQWGVFVDKAFLLIEESRQRAINAELADLRSAIRRAGSREAEGQRGDFTDYRTSPPKPPDDRFYGSKPPDDRFESAEPPWITSRFVGASDDASQQVFPAAAGFVRGYSLPTGAEVERGLLFGSGPCLAPDPNGDHQSDSNS